MIRKLVVAACAVAAAGWAHAWQPQDIDPDLLEYIEQVEQDTGLKRFGQVMLGELEGADATTVSVRVDPSVNTVIAVICGPSCELIDGTAYNASGKQIAKAEYASTEAIVHVPAGNGDRVDVKVDMLTCGWDTCPYAIQAFTAPAR